MSLSEQPHEYLSSLETTGKEQLSRRGAIIAEMRRLAPPGQQALPATTVEQLRARTYELLEAEGSQAIADYERFLEVKERGLNLPTGTLYKQLHDKTVVVTGGTGCVGSALLRELTQFAPGRVISISRGITRPSSGVVDGVEYVYADIRDHAKLKETFQVARPDIVYHLAAQHDPSLAETAVAHTLSTNITGTRSVIEAAKASSAPQLVYASTGKAVRPFTPDTYAASKKVGEWLFADATVRNELLCSGVRFTHVVDNSIIHRRLQNWITHDQPIRLHDPDILFYMQSAKEAAHLLLNAGLEAEPQTFKVQAIRDLEWPINLMDLALGAIAKADTITPIYLCGFEAGYEEKPYPGLYDPSLSGELSPLINAFEAAQTRASLTCPQVDTFPFTMTTDAHLVQQLTILEEACNSNAPVPVLHEAKDALSWAMLDTRLQSVSKIALERTALRMAKTACQGQQIEDHERVTKAIVTALQNRREV